MIYHKSQKTNRAVIEPETDNWVTAKLALQILSVMILIYLAELAG